MHLSVLLLLVLSPIIAQMINSDSQEKLAATTQTAPSNKRQDNLRFIPPKPSHQMWENKTSSLLRFIYDYDRDAGNHIHYHDKFQGPTFEVSASAGNQTIDVDTGETVVLNCRVFLVKDIKISWLRDTGSTTLQLIAIDETVYVPDSRFKVRMGGDNWQLVITDANYQDSGSYHCQISTHPPMVKSMKLIVHPPEITMIQEVYLATSETLTLTCIIMYLKSKKPIINWFKDNKKSLEERWDGGVSIETQIIHHISSELKVYQLKVEDAGVYECVLEAPIVMKTFCIVRVLRGSDYGELHSGVQMTTVTANIFCLLVIFMFVVLLTYLYVVRSN